MVFQARGQAFETFKILIAAIVPIAILGVLMPIILGIGTFGGNAIEDTVTLVKNASGNIGSQSEKQVTFNESSRLITKSLLSEKTGGFSDSSFCFGIDSGVSSSLFSKSGSGANEQLEYKGTTSTKVRVQVGCKRTTTGSASSLTTPSCTCSGTPAPSFCCGIVIKPL